MSDTRLIYSFTPTPYPVTVSIGRDKPHASQIDLLVMINNRNEAVDVESIAISIPVGTEDGFTLSSAVNLPAPVPGAWSSQWNIHVSGSQITITPVSASNNTLATTLMFVLPGIAVNQTQGNVPITIAETSPSRNGTAELVKVDADFPVRRFYIEQNGTELNPPVLYDLDQQVVLKWDCSTQGEKSSYRLRQLNDDWASGGLGCQDGRAGVSSQPLRDSSTFALDVLDPSGNTTDTLKLTVLMSVPKIVSAHIKKYFSARIVSLHWIALNAASCDVELDGIQIHANAPTDTYTDGHVFVINSGPGKYLPSVVANPKTGSASDTNVFDPVNIAPFVTIPVGRQLNSLALATPDGKRLLLGTGATNLFGYGRFDDDWLTLVDLDTGARRDITVGPAASRLAVTPNGKLALVLIHNSQRTYGKQWEWTEGAVVLMDLPAGTVRPNSIAVGKRSADIAVTPNGKFALVSDSDGSLRVINLTTFAVERTIESLGSGANAIGITSNEKLALVTTEEGKVRVIDLTTFTLEPKAIVTDPSDRYPSRVAITPDSKLALIANLGSVRVIDIDNRRAESPVIPVGTSSTVTITPDGKLAIVTNFGEDVFKVIRLADRHAAPIDYKVGFGIPDLVISKDGATAIAATENYTVTFV